MYWFLIHYPVRLYVDELFGFLPFSKTMFIGILETAVIFAITIIITNIILHCKSQKATAIVS